MYDLLNEGGVTLLWNKVKSFNHILIQKQNSAIG